jgi:FtsP/CotA-like multicopper oxidase with cupredoxin domain
MKMNRRTFVMAAGAAAGALAFGGMLKFPTTAAAAIPGGTLDPAAITKYVQPLVIPGVMPRSEDQNNFDGDYYKIAVSQFEQQILPPGMPLTTVWSYGSVNHPRTFSYPAFTVEAKYNKPVRVKWINDLKDKNGRFLPHILPVDQTLHWANPPGVPDGRDMAGNNPAPYDGPVPIVVHLHGGHTDEESDGFPEAWFLPDANNIPAGYSTEGSKYNEFKTKFETEHPGVTWQPGTAVFEYDNDQRATTMWYHDHALGMTRNNVYAGPAGFYLLRGGPGDRDLEYNPPGENRDNDEPITEIPIVIQDRSFNTDGSLFYPDSREFFDAFPGPYAPDSDIAPIWNPEFFGNTMVVNGRTWPKLKVEKRRYRFRFLNGSDSRFLILKMSNDMPFYQIGADGGFLPAPVQLNELLIGPAERADVIVDFSRISRGSRIILQNIGPDEPFGGGVPGTDFDPADPATTGEVMRFDVVARTSEDDTTPPTRLRLPAPPALGTVNNTRQVSLNEVDSDILPGIGPRAALLGTVDLTGITPVGIEKMWAEAITENPAVNAIEIWEIYNFTEDAHPIHIHEVQFQVVNREVIIDGAVRAPEVWESGEKDTVIAYPGEITRVKARYDRAGLFVWHCHILSHEDHEMMRPYRIG